MEKIEEYFSKKKKNLLSMLIILFMGFTFLSPIKTNAATRINITTIATGFNYPFGIAVDSNGNLFVADQFGSAIKEIKLKSDGSYDTNIESIGTGYSYPMGIVLDSDGNIFVADTSNKVIKKIIRKPDGSYDTSNIKSISTGKVYIYAVAVDSNGNIFFCDANNNAIKEINIKPDGSYDTSNIKNIGSGYSSPQGIAIDSHGNIFVSDTGNNAVKEIKIKADGSYDTSNIESIGTGYNSPMEITVDSNGNLYVADYFNNAIKEIKLKADGGYDTSNIKKYDLGTNSNGSPVSPTGVAVDSNGNIFVVGNSSDGNVRKVNEIEIYTVSYNGNGSTGGLEPIDTKSYASGETAQIANNTTYLVKSGYTFAGWNTKADGTGTDYAAGSSLSISGDLTLYAKWIEATPSYTVEASAASQTPIAGIYDMITLKVKDSKGNIDATFNGSKNVTVSGCSAAPGGSYGDINYKTKITQQSTMTMVDFSGGNATLNLRLTNAAAQNLVFNVEGVNTPNADAISITPVPAVAEKETLTQDIAAPLSNGGKFAQQPIVTIMDLYGNVCVNDNTTQVYASKFGTGEWTLTGTKTVTAKNGIVRFNDLGATNEAAVTGAKLSFGLSDGVISSGTVNLPAPGSNEISVVSAKPLDNMNVDYETDISNIGFPKTVDVELSNGSTTSAAVKWNDGTPTYDKDKSGTYRFTGDLKLIDTILNPKNVEATVNVIVGSSNNTTPAAVTCDLNYTAGDGGTIKGEKSQTVNSGEDGSEVIAVPNSNYYFAGWSDGKTDARRKDINVKSNINASAIFKANSSTSSSTSSSSSHSSSSSSSSSRSSSEEQITVNVTDGSSKNTVSQTVIKRTIASDGSKNDTVTYTPDKAKETIEALTKEGKDVARIVATDSDSSVSQTQVNIPKETLSALSSGKVNLEIQVNGAIVSVPKESVQGLAASGQLNGDLYFRVVPIKDEAKQEAIKTTADKEAVVKAVAGNDGVQVLGTPMTIETNMGQRPVEITLPLTGINLPTDSVQRQAFLNDLGVFIEHSDGEKVLEKGTVVDYGNGVLGIKFKTSKFSDFTIVKLNQNTKAGWKLTNGSWYFMNNDGTMAKGWHKANNGEWTYGGKDTVNTWFHLDADGKMNTGWFKDSDGSWYFLCDGRNYGALGVMETGWKEIDGVWYYLNSDGSMAASTTIDGYQVDGNGAWIQ